MWALPEAPPLPAGALVNWHMADGVAGDSYSVGVSFKQWHSSALKRRARLHLLKLRVGDVYVFNANRVHEIMPVGSGLARVVLGSFVGYSDTELAVWA